MGNPCRNVEISKNQKTILDKEKPCVFFLSCSTFIMFCAAMLRRVTTGNTLICTMYWKKRAKQSEEQKLMKRLLKPPQSSARQSTMSLNLPLSACQPFSSELVGWQQAVDQIVFYSCQRKDTRTTKKESYFSFIIDAKTR